MTDRPARKKAAARKNARPKTAKAKADKVKPRKPVALMVLGMHRSGTEALAGTLGLLGCDLPRGAETQAETPAAPRADHMGALLDDLLASAASRWDDWLPLGENWFGSGRAEAFRDRALALVQEDYGASRLFVLADPRNCRLVPFWDQVWEGAGADPRFLLIHRNPLAVADALADADGIDRQLAMFIWLRHVLSAEAETRGRRRSFTSHEAFMANWQGTAERLQSDLKIALPCYALGITGSVESHLAAQPQPGPQTPEAVQTTPAVPAWVADVHAILERWVAGGEDPADHARLDEVHAVFEAATPAFLRLIEQARAPATPGPVAAASAEIDALKVRLEAAETERARLARELHSRETEADSRAQDQGEDLQRLRDELAQTQSALRQRSHEAEETAASLQQMRARLTEAEARNDQLARDAEKAAEQSAALTGELATLRDSAEAEQRQRFDEVADLTRRIVEQEEAAAARLAEVEAARQHLDEEAAQLRPRVQAADLLSERLSHALATILEGDARGGRLLSRLADRRKARLIERLGLFDRAWYLEVNADVRETGADPALHFVRHGYAEGRAARADMPGIVRRG